MSHKYLRSLERDLKDIYDNLDNEDYFKALDSCKDQVDIDIIEKYTKEYSTY